MEKKPGYIVVFEGVDGIGKTTLLKNRKEYLKEILSRILEIGEEIDKYSIAYLKIDNFRAGKDENWYLKNFSEKVKKIGELEKRDGKILVIDRAGIKALYQYSKVNAPTGYQPSGYEELFKFGIREAAKREIDVLSLLDELFSKVDLLVVLYHPGGKGELKEILQNQGWPGTANKSREEFWAEWEDVYEFYLNLPGLAPFRKYSKKIRLIPNYRSESLP